MTQINKNKTDKQIRVHVYVSGQVHGVGFRWWCRKEAEELGLAGWVRNTTNGKLKMQNGKLPDGNGVEGVFEGPKAAVEKMLEWCRQGSPSARVQEVKVGWEKPEGLTGFVVRR